MGTASATTKIFAEASERLPPSPDIITYNIILNGLVKEKKKFSSMEYVFEEMILKSRQAQTERSLKPTKYTYSAMINGAVDAGDLDAAEKYFHMMKEKDRLKPD